ncbi:MAG: chromosomal replication initiator protein DnaA [Clostridia bacterium]|nr:chromosomal replication initiator protein DnaA [Clostridia bacterium]
MDDFSSILEPLKEKLKEKTGAAKTSFDLWFGDLNITSFTEDCVVFSTPTKLRKKILSTRYLQVLKDSLEETVGFPINIDIISLDDEDDFPKYSYSEIPREENESKKEENIKREKDIQSILKDTTEKRTILDEYTFDNFVEGESNKFAKAACMAVAKYPCEDQNPLFIHGHSGLGKTHLLYAIMHHIKKNRPELKIVYKTCESFMNELIEAIGNRQTAPFKDKYRSADVLLIDDIQFIAGKESTQEEFFHTFSTLYEAGKQIILASDRPPREINPLTDRLRTRFEGGLIADVQPPSFELRTAIIRKKSETLGITLSSELVDYMAERLNNNIRQIEGVIKKLYAIVSLTGADVSKESIEQIISIVDPGNIPTNAMIERILSAVSLKYGVSVEDIKSKKKTENIVNARHLSIYITRKLTDLSLPAIGKIFSRDHSTIISSINKVDINIRTVKNYEEDLNSLIKEIKGL